MWKGGASAPRSAEKKMGLCPRVRLYPLLQPLLPGLRKRQPDASPLARRPLRRTPQSLRHRIPRHRHSLPPPRMDRRSNRHRSRQVWRGHSCPRNLTRKRRPLAEESPSRRPLRSHIPQRRNRPACRRPHPCRSQPRSPCHHRQQRPHRPRLPRTPRPGRESKASASSSNPP